MVRVYYMKNKLRMQVEALFGPVHRLINDHVRGLCQAGVFGNQLVILLMVNISFGPWHGGGFFHMLTDMALDIVVGLDPDNPLLLKLWPKICLDRGWEGQDYRTRESRTNWLRDLPLAPPFQRKGKKASMSRFFSVDRAFEAMDMYWHTILFVEAVLVERKGWSSSWDDLWSPGPLLPPDLKKPIMGSAASSSKDAPPVAAKAAPKTLSKAAAQAAAKSKINTLVQQSANMLHSVCKLRTDEDVCSTSRLVTLASSPYAAEYTRLTKHVKGEDATIRYHIAMAKGEWYQSCLDAFATCRELPALKTSWYDCGLRLRNHEEV